MSSACCPQDSQRSPWINDVPSVWKALFYSPSPTFIQLLKAHSAFRTSSLLWSLFPIPPALFFVPPLSVPRTCNRQSTHHIWVHLFPYLSPESSMRTGNESCLSLYPPCLANGLAVSKHCMTMFWLKFYGVKYLATSFYFILITTSWAPTPCQVLCCEIGYVPWSETETVIRLVISAVIGGCAGVVGAQRRHLFSWGQRTWRPRWVLKTSRSSQVRRKGKDIPGGGITLAKARNSTLCLGSHKSLDCVSLE